MTLRRGADKNDDVSAFILMGGKGSRARIEGAELKKGCFPTPELWTPVERLLAQLGTAGITRVWLVWDQSPGRYEKDFLTSSFEGMTIRFLEDCFGDGYPLLSLGKALPAVKHCFTDPENAPCIVCVSDHVWSDALLTLFDEKVGPGRLAYAGLKGEFAGCVKASFSTLEKLCVSANSLKKGRDVIASYPRDAKTAVETPYLEVGSVEGYADYLLESMKYDQALAGGETFETYGNPRILIRVDSKENKVSFYGAKGELTEKTGRSSAGETSAFSLPGLLEQFGKLDFQQKNPSTGYATAMGTMPGFGDVFVKFASSGPWSLQLENQARWSFYCRGFYEHISWPVVFKRAKKGCYFVMRHIRTASTLETLKIDDAARFPQDFQKMLEALRSLYSLEFPPVDIVKSRTSKELFIDRLHQRYDLLRDMTEGRKELSEIFKAEEMTINDQPIEGLRRVTSGLSSPKVSGLLDSLGSGLIHGDPHLGNALLDHRRQIYFVDSPGGLEKKPISYDLGKIGQNILGRLELIRRGTALFSRIRENAYRFNIDAPFDSSAAGTLIGVYADICGKPSSAVQAALIYSTVIHLLSAAPLYAYDEKRQRDLILMSLNLYHHFKSCLFEGG